MTRINYKECTLKLLGVVLLFIVSMYIIKPVEASVCFLPDDSECGEGESGSTHDTGFWPGYEGGDDDDSGGCDSSYNSLKAKNACGENCVRCTDGGRYNGLYKCPTNNCNCDGYNSSLSTNECGESCDRCTIPGDKNYGFYKCPPAVGGCNGPCDGCTYTAEQAASLQGVNKECVKCEGAACQDKWRCYDICGMNSSNEVYGSCPSDSIDKSNHCETCRDSRQVDEYCVCDNCLGKNKTKTYCENLQVGSHKTSKCKDECVGKGSDKWCSDCCTQCDTSYYQYTSDTKPTGSDWSCSEPCQDTCSGKTRYRCDRECNRLADEAPNESQCKTVPYDCSDDCGGTRTCYKSACGSIQKCENGQCVPNIDESCYYKLNKMRFCLTPPSVSDADADVYLIPKYAYSMFKYGEYYMTDGPDACFLIAYEGDEQLYIHGDHLYKKQSDLFIDITSQAGNLLLGADDAVYDVDHVGTKSNGYGRAAHTAFLVQCVYTWNDTTVHMIDEYNYGFARFFGVVTNGICINASTPSVEAYTPFNINGCECPEGYERIEDNEGFHCVGAECYAVITVNIEGSGFNVSVPPDCADNKLTMDLKYTCSNNLTQKTISALLYDENDGTHLGGTGLGDCTRVLDWEATISGPTTSGSVTNLVTGSGNNSNSGVLTLPDNSEIQGKVRILIGENDCITAGTCVAREMYHVGCSDSWLPDFQRVDPDPNGPHSTVYQQNGTDDIYSDSYLKNWIGTVRDSVCMNLEHNGQPYPWLEVYNAYNFHEICKGVYKSTVGFFKCENPICQDSEYPYSSCTNVYCSTDHLKQVTCEEHTDTVNGVTCYKESVEDCTCSMAGYPDCTDGCSGNSVLTCIPFDYGDETCYTRSLTPCGDNQTCYDGSCCTPNDCSEYTSEYTFIYIPLIEDTGTETCTPGCGDNNPRYRCKSGYHWKEVPMTGIYCQEDCEISDLSNNELPDHSYCTETDTAIIDTKCNEGEVCREWKCYSGYHKDGDKCVPDSSSNCHEYEELYNEVLYSSKNECEGENEEWICKVIDETDEYYEPEYAGCYYPLCADASRMDTSDWDIIYFGNNSNTVGVKWDGTPLDNMYNTSQCWDCCINQNDGQMDEEYICCPKTARIGGSSGGNTIVYLDFQDYNEYLGVGLPYVGCGYYFIYTDNAMVGPNINVSDISITTQCHNYTHDWSSALEDIVSHPYSWSNQRFLEEHNYGNQLPHNSADICPSWVDGDHATTGVVKKIEINCGGSVKTIDGSYGSVTCDYRDQGTIQFIASGGGCAVNTDRF